MRLLVDPSADLYPPTVIWVVMPNPFLFLE